ncbi:MAG: hypothetical protein KBC84_01895 [Proteobacteria bacterium]|nr:hypothetical protein [Pseudomonadota bacterium]
MFGKVNLKSFKIILLIALLAPFQVKAEQNQYTTYNSPRFTLYFGHTENGKKLFSKNVAQKSLELLNQTADEYSNIFQMKLNNVVVLKFLTPEEFKRTTGAPEWTSAMFYRGEISIPLPQNKVVNFSELERALRHEYTHSVIAQISDYKCPAWLDEGIAQILEGDVNPILAPSLRKWVNNSPLLPLDWLNNGFTTLEEHVVPVAYAESLYITKKLVDQKGYPAIVKYLKLLKEEAPENYAFEHAFGTTKREFMKKMDEQVVAWAKSNEKNP